MHILFFIVITMRKTGCKFCYSNFHAKLCQQFSRDIMAYKVRCKLQNRLLVLHSDYVSDKKQAVRVATQYAPAPPISLWAPKGLARRRADAT